MVQYRDSYTWGKYCQRFMELDFYGEGHVKNNIHGSFRSSMINFLQTDIAGTPTYSMNPNILGQLQQFLVQFSDPELDKRLLSSMWDRHLENNETKKYSEQAIKNCNYSHCYSIFNFYKYDVSTFWKAQILGVNP